MLLRLLLLLCAPLFEAQGGQSSSPELSLDVRPLQPMEGGSVTLTCKVKEGSQMLQFCILKNGEELKMGWRTSPEFQIAAARKEDSGSYQCMAKTRLSKFHRSSAVQIRVQGVPVSNVRLETQPQGGYVTEGEKLVLLCLVAGGTGNITFFWYKGTLGLNLETKTQPSLTAKFEIPTARVSDTDQYYCAADNGYGPSLSELVDVAVRIPVSQPTFTLGVLRAPPVVGDVVELHCEAPRGSPPISYWFYHEDVPLGSSPAPSGGGASFNLSLTAEHSGNYSCEADNGLGAQRSEVVSLNITAPKENRGSLSTSAIIEGLLGAVGFTAVILSLCCWLRKKLERPPAGNVLRSSPGPGHQDATYLNSSVPRQRDSVYQNANITDGDKIYSLVYRMEQEQPLAAAGLSRTHVEEKDPAVIYSWLKKADHTDEDYEDAM